MTRGMTTSLPSRRSVLAAAAAFGGTALVGDGARADNPANLPPNVPRRGRARSATASRRGLRQPSQIEKHVVRRDVQWLTASRESSVSFTPLHELDGIITPNGLCFERHHGGIAEIDPEDYRLISTAWSTSR